MRIFLIGFMGSGKTTIGKQLASSLGYRFLDSDFEIQKQFDLKISDIFEKFGEERFREAEKEWISNIHEYDNIVISTGGGLPCHFNNIGLMNHLGITIYLKTDSKTLINRLIHSRNNRPLLKYKSEAELSQYVNSKLIEREPYYSQATHIIQAIDIKVQDIINILAAR